jgi:hypothetical protein
MPAEGADTSLPQGNERWQRPIATDRLPVEQERYLIEIQQLLLDKLTEAAWNANAMDHNMLLRLRESIGRFGMIQNLVVRPIEDDVYEVLSGNQRRG